MVVMVRAVVCLSLWMAVCQVRGFNIPVEMNRTIQNIVQHYNSRLTQRQIFNGKAVFTEDMMPEQLEAKKIVMGGVLNTYEELINEMLKDLTTPSPPTAGSTTASETQLGSGGSVRRDLIYILDKIKKLKKHRYQEQDKVLKGLQQLKEIKMNKTEVQVKALLQLSDLYHEASSLTNGTKKEQQRRRRRQARKANKNHARG